MGNLRLAVKGLFRLVIEGCNNSCASLPESRVIIRQVLNNMRSVLMVTAFTIVVMSVLVLVMGGAALMILKIFTFLVTPLWQGTLLEGAAASLDEANRHLSGMTFFKVGVPVFLTFWLCSILSSMGITRKGLISVWRKLVEVGKDN